MYLEQSLNLILEFLQSETCGINRHIERINRLRNDDFNLLPLCDADYIVRAEEIPNKKVFIDVLYEDSQSIIDSREEIGQISINLGFTASADNKDYRIRCPRYREALKKTIIDNLKFKNLDLKLESLSAPTKYNFAGATNIYVIKAVVSMVV